MNLLLKEDNISFGYDDSKKQLEKELKFVDKIVNKYDKLDNNTKYKILEHWTAPLWVDRNKKINKWYNTLPKGGVFYYGFKRSKI